MMLNQGKLETAIETKKRSYSYQDLINMQSTSVYSSLGKVIPSTKPSAPYATFGHSQRKVNPKIFDTEAMAKIDTAGKLGLGPAAYLPSQQTLSNGQVITAKNIADDLPYKSTPQYSIGKSPRRGQTKQIYNHMFSKKDDLDINQADASRKTSIPNCRIGTDARFHSERKDKITPAPTYDPVLKPEIPNAPKYTLGSRRSIKGKDPLLQTGSTTALVGPSSYFQKGKKSSSAAILRVPSNSTIKNQPKITFAKGPKSLVGYKSSMDQTYDLKTKTMMAHYDFEYDAGKGLNSGLAYMKKHINQSCKNPLQKNKMKSYTITHANRQTQQKRGTFISMMSQVQQSVPLRMPKF